MFTNISPSNKFQYCSGFRTTTGIVTVFSFAARMNGLIQYKTDTSEGVHHVLEVTRFSAVVLPVTCG